MTIFSVTAPAQTIFGRDSRLGAATHVARLGARVLLVSGRSVPWVETFAAELRALGLAVARHYSAGEPSLGDVRDGVSAARRFRVACVVAIGGGASIDLGKAIAGLAGSEGDPEEYLELGPAPARCLNNPLPFVAMPTTAGTGAEATRNAVISLPEQQLKISLRDPRLVPALAIVDPALTDGLPKALTLATGLDAITQLIESYLCNRANPVSDALCRDTLPEAITALRCLMEGPSEAARDTMARASYLSGLALANSGLGVVHGLASVIGGRGGAHGAICGRLLADALHVNRTVAARAGLSARRYDDVDGWLREGLGGADSGPECLRSFVDRHGLPTLRDLHLPESDFDAVARASLGASSTKANPVALSEGEIVQILLGAARSF
ncbi:iron-containing alcohol dehydrogenase [Sedimentimonas flavescens]|uniref:Iron-containing alcohol dehydrogenase n=1 Tax=Sedimentimonas flavescens TaxID=2851012 RepID=A0ABT3A042_9RHOB|nr:iron-containing alcohol dehydrogenase [Sedimentimonas flavescens]MCV2879378.1 iron-containing alcohol dehydrogenase [Sedimentimonas flavescens]